MGHFAELVVHHVADQRIGLADAGPGGEQLFPFGALDRRLLAQHGLARGAFRLQFLRARLARRRRPQGIFRRQGQGGLGHHPELVRRHLAEAQALAAAAGGQGKAGEAEGCRGQDRSDGLRVKAHGRNSSAGPIDQ